ncbi:MAG: hypothetical protein HN952_05120 [Candidatus Cloacimonetes bacterium]|jgi:cell division protein FtsL|nr:hypothetical protein [Candidatus Cloacimonadota bacterium]MBT6994322.1 hypothetical protein [Candidatus Cloacimonadota bacterium]MBT7469482.1 hypothetical protein [Candidatus Cloacimonadota bacterium]
MIKKIAFFIFLVFVIIFLHFQNGHQIKQYSRDCENIQKNIDSQKEIAKYLCAKNNSLCSRKRIVELAKERLDMSFPDEERENIITVKLENNNSKATFLDLLIPSADALNR